MNTGGEDLLILKKNNGFSFKYGQFKYLWNIQ